MTAHDSRTFDIFDQQGEALVIELRRLQRALAARLDEEVWVEAAPSVVQHDGGEEESRSVFGRYFRVIGDAIALLMTDEGAPELAQQSTLVAVPIVALALMFLMFKSQK